MKSQSFCLRIRAAALAASLTTALIGCGSSAGTTTAAVKTVAPTGAITLRITDSPIDFADHVFIQVRGIQLQNSNGSGSTFYYCEGPGGERVLQQTDCAQSAPLSFDVLALTDGLSDVLLGDQKIEAGKYVWMRLLVDAVSGVRDSFIVTGGAEYELTMPSNEQTGLKIVRGFDVDANEIADFTVDFDLRKSVINTKTGTEFMLRPTLRVVDSFASGAVAGTVDTSWMTQSCVKAVIYAFAGADVTPDDIDMIGAEPVTTARVHLDPVSGNYTYKLAFLDPGDYTVAFLCQGAGDDVEKNDTLIFSGATNVTVASGNTTQLDLGP